MGYHIELMNNSFCIRRENEEDCLKAIKSMDPANGSGRAYDGNITSRHFAWVDFEKVQRAETLDEVFEEWGYSVYRYNDVISDIILSTHTKIGDEEICYTSFRNFVVLMETHILYSRFLAELGEA